MGLRELKKQRTRETITRVALDLFTTKGFAATTLAEIAEAAEIAPSTLHAYFPSKDSIVVDAGYRDHVSERIVARPAGESTVETISQWLAEPGARTSAADTKLEDRRRQVIEGDDSLRARERLSRAMFEDLLADAFARDLGLPPDSLDCRVMAAAASHALTRCETSAMSREAVGRDLESMLAALARMPGRIRADDAYAA